MTISPLLRAFPSMAWLDVNFRTCKSPLHCIYVESVIMNNASQFSHDGSKWRSVFVSLSSDFDYLEGRQCVKSLPMATHDTARRWSSAAAGSGAGPRRAWTPRARPRPSRRRRCTPPGSCPASTCAALRGVGRGTGGEGRARGGGPSRCAEQGTAIHTHSTHSTHSTRTSLERVAPALRVALQAGLDLRAVRGRVEHQQRRARVAALHELLEAYHAWCKL